MTQVSVGRPPDATDELQTVLTEWGTDDLGEIAPTVIAEVRARVGRPPSIPEPYVALVATTTVAMALKFAKSASDSFQDLTHGNRP
jgi:hypothetical protein